MMLELGRHAPFILGSYLAAIVLLGALAAWILLDRRARARELARLGDRRGWRP